MLARKMMVFKCTRCVIILLFALCVNGHNDSYKYIEDQQQKDCPLWFHYNSSLQECQCSQSQYSTQCAADGQDAFVKSDYIATYDQSKEIVSISFRKSCRFLHNPSNVTIPGYTLLPKNVSLLNELMCGPLNREGYLCKDCIRGYGLATTNLMACYEKCYNCTTQHWYGVAIYTIVELIPLTLFYQFILMFRISFTSAPMTCFVLYSQMIILVFYIAWDEPLLSSVVYTEERELRSVSKFILTLYGTFNLDFFRYALPPFCISTHLTPLQRIFLGYISAFYPLVLIFLTWLCIELHDYNFKPIVIFWRPFHRCLVRLRKGWDTRNDLIDVFSSFFLLSYAKVMYQTILVLSTTINYNFSLSGNYISEIYVLDADISIPTSSVLYITSVVLAGLASCLFNLLPILLLVLYPTSVFRKALSKCRLDRFALTIFVEKFHSCYRDGLSGGKDMRSFSGMYFLLQIILFVGVLILYDYLDFEQWFLRGTIFSTAALVIALCRPYKKTLINVSDTLLLFLIAVICYILSSDTKTKFFVPFMQILFLIPFIVFCVLVIFRIVWRILRLQITMSLLHYLRLIKVAETDITEAERQQLIQPVIT